ncbi:MAG: hypothetical protein EOM20_20945, partial [Spartobacteria bacterium]|nr:hypothetical protein [Spartobacteria bacterium]
DTLLVIAYEEMSLFHSSGFSALRVLDRETRPFAKDRQGFHLAPAIAMARLSRKDASVRLSAFAISNDAHHPTGPHRTGDGIRQCIESCLQQRHLRPEDIDAIKLNGTGTPYSDEAEYKALSAVFGDRLPSIPAFFFKAKLGHLQGAGGLVESLMTLQALQLNLVPAIPAPVAEQLDFPLNLSSEPREMERRNCLLVYSGIGGHNVCLLMEKRPAMAEIPHG